MTEPRCVHYQFAHVALRSLVFSAPELVDVLWALDDPSALLDEIAGQVEQVCQSRGDDEVLRGADLRVHKRRIGSHVCMLVEFPAPIATPEAFMVAIVSPREPDGERAAGPCRYFTLEYSAQREPPRTVLGEWTAQGSHLNMGGGPEPELDAFTAELARFILD
jgi:hypothetical protein